MLLNFNMKISFAKLIKEFPKERLYYIKYIEKLIVFF